MVTYRIGWLVIAVCTLVGGTIAVTVLGFESLVGETVGLLVLLALLSSPSAVRAYGRWLRSVPAPSEAHLDPFVRIFVHAGVGFAAVHHEPEPHALTDDELSERWRASCLYLQRRHPAKHVMRAVEQRRAYLDEFERRYPGGYTAWLTSGARTMDYLTPYAIRGSVDEATINWDELTRGRD